MIKSHRFQHRERLSVRRLLSEPRSVGRTLDAPTRTSRLSNPLGSVRRAMPDVGGALLWLWPVNGEGGAEVAKGRADRPSYGTLR